jgi:hypothetical protein
MFEAVRRFFARLGSSARTELVPAPMFKEALQSAFSTRLLSHGFEYQKDLKWVRSVNAPMRELIELYALKGASFAPRWGFSLDFVPHVASGRVRWHRTAKSAELDLIWDPLDFAGAEGWTVSRICAPSDVPSQVREYARKVCDAALSDVERATEVAALPALYREWAGRRSVRFSFLNYQQAAIGEAFVLARLGLPGALECLRAGMARFDLEPQVTKELEKRLAAVDVGA